MIFVDTSALLARHHRRDQHHRAAEAYWRDVEEFAVRCVTSNFVLDETFTLLGRRVGYRFAAARARAVYDSALLEVLRPEEADERRALALFEKFADQGVSFTDAVSFALMRRHRIERVFTFDRHFALAGFLVVPEGGAPGWIAEGEPEPVAEDG